MYYVFIPKFKETLTEDVSVKDIEDKIVEYFADKDIHFEKVEFDRQQVNWFFARKTLMEKATEYPKRYTTSCKWCDYQKYCSTNGKDTSELVEKDKEVSLFA